MSSFVPPIDSAPSDHAAHDIQTVIVDRQERTSGAPIRKSVAERWIREGRYVRLLSSRSGNAVDASMVERAWDALLNRMARVPAGAVALSPTPYVVNYAVGASPSGHAFSLHPSMAQTTSIDSLYIDRCAVTNADFLHFASDGGYQDLQWWPEDVWPLVLQMVDSTGKPGPRFWSHGQPPRKLLEHPVVGVCYYEAMAYARWAGKNLPSAGQWQRAGTWHEGAGGTAGQLRYPWGNAFDPKRANTFAANVRSTLPVNANVAGCTPNGIYQLIGNTWEWVVPDSINHEAQHGPGKVAEYAEIRGGAFDTYFESQATCQFRSAHNRRFRGPNVGFRCCVAVSELRPRSE